MTVNFEWQAAQARLGVSQWLRPGDHEQVEKTLQDLQALNINRLRTGISWADWQSPYGRKWFDWLIPRICQHMELVPCITFAAVNPNHYVDFIDTIITAYGEYFDWLDLWNEPINFAKSDIPDWKNFCEMIGLASHWSKSRSKKTLLSGVCPTDLNWLEMAGSHGVLIYIDAIGLRGLAGTSESDSNSWPQKLAKAREIFDKHNLDLEIWITEAGYSTWQQDEIGQIKTLMDALEAPVERVYWHSAYDMLQHGDFHRDTQPSSPRNNRNHYFGLKTADGSAKLIYRVWQQGGLGGLHKLADRAFQHNGDLSPSAAKSNEQTLHIHIAQTVKKPVLITGGAGFIGANVADRLLQEGEKVLIFDNLSHPGSERNLEWLCDTYGNNVELKVADVCDRHLVGEAVRRCSRIFHFAAQTAISVSIKDPQRDFDINVHGTLNILETLRHMKSPPPLLFASTNQIYGTLDEIAVEQVGLRYQPKNSQHRNGINESQQLDFCTPYGCSKGAADQYVLDYARTFGIPAVVFRLSCVYGPRQYGTEEQGWVAHFLRQWMAEKTLTLQGDGRQVRDILFVDDLVDAVMLAQKHMGRLSGQAFNIGGGPAISISLLEMMQHLERLIGRPCPFQFADWRFGDQKFYIADTQQFRQLTGWQPCIGIEEGLAQFCEWALENRFDSTNVMRPTPAYLLQQGALNNVWIR